MLLFGADTSEYGSLEADRETHRLGAQRMQDVLLRHVVLQRRNFYFGSGVI